jgi:MFS family permease
LYIESSPTRPKSWFERVFVNKNIFSLWSGQVISQAGDSIFEIGLLWLLLDLTGSNAVTGLVAMSSYLPTLLFGLYSGALVDRFDRRKLMLFADLARGCIVLIIPLLYFLDGLNGLILGLLTFAVASFNTLFNPARDALVAHLVAPGQLMTANSMIQTSWQYAMFLGPAIAGILLSVVGPVHLFNVDALTFFLSFYFIYKISVNRPASQPVKPVNRAQFGQEVRQVWRDVLDGISYARRDRRVWALLIITAVDNLFLMGPALIGAPIFVREILQQEASAYAFIQVAYAVGMIIGTILLNLYGKYFRNSHIMLWGIIFDGLTFLPLVWVNTFWGAFLTITFHAVAIPMIVVARPTIIQKIVPAEMQGRIFSMISIAVYGFTAISIALTGAAAEIIPINIIYGIIAILAAASGAAGWFIREFREI